MKIRRFKLNVLSAETLQQKEMSVLIGGADSCGCACAYEGMGGPSFSDNTNANYKYGYTSNTCNFTQYSSQGYMPVCRPKAS